MISAAIFDVANVIVDWDAVRALEGVVPPADIEAFLASEEFWEINARTDAGLLLSDGLVELDELAPHLVATYRVYLRRFPLTVSGPVPGTSAVIDELLAEGVPTFGLSNWSAENFNVARRAAPVIDRLADVIVSGEVGLAKPDPQIFRYALHRFGLEPQSTVMIDDTPANLETAAGVGLRTILFTDADQLRRDLTSSGLLPVR